MRNYLKNLQVAFGEVFANTSYIALASTLAISAFLFAVWLPNFGLIGEVFSTSSAPLTAKLKIVIALLGGIGTNFSFLSAGYTIAIAAFFGVNIAMVVYFLKRTRTRLARQDVAAGFGGIASGALAILPLRGGEFGILSVVLLALSLVLISKKIAAPLICKPS